MVVMFFGVIHEKCCRLPAPTKEGALADIKISVTEGILGISVLY
jgi:hypothetical protein